MKKYFKGLFLLLLISTLVLQTKIVEAASSWYGGYRVSVSIASDSRSSSHTITGENPGGFGLGYYTKRGNRYSFKVKGTASKSTWTAYKSIKTGRIYKAETHIVFGSTDVYKVTEISD